MENRNRKKGMYFLVLSLVLLLLLFLIIWYIKQKPPVKDWMEYVMKDPSAVPVPDPSKQLVVFLKPEAQRANFNKWINDSLVTKGEVQIRFICGSCDSSLFLFEGTGVEDYIKEKLLLMGGGLARGGNAPQNPPKPAGETEEIYYSTNVRVKADVAVDEEIIPLVLAQPGYSEAPVKVAVFDTGVDTLTAGSFKYQPVTEACIPGANHGWNFMGTNSNWRDDYQGRHGTVVTRFITNEVVKYGKNGVEILPVKIFDKDGSSDLFSVLCAFAYASQQQVNIINASFGYYESMYEIDVANGRVSNRLTSPVLLKAFVEKHLTQKNILLIAAAGNKSDAEDSVYNPVDPADQRNLDSVHFYPASLATHLPNVVVVTTAYDSLVSPRQNFSNKIVDVCVQADGIFQDAYNSLLFAQAEIDTIRNKINTTPVMINKINPNIVKAKEKLNHFYDELNYPHFSFFHPYKAGHTVEGSSFATPIVTGKFAAWFHLYRHLLDSGVVFTTQTKDSIFQIIKNKPGETFLFTSNQLSGKIKQGKIIYRSFDKKDEGKGQLPVNSLNRQPKAVANEDEKRK